MSFFDYFRAADDDQVRVMAERGGLLPGACPGREQLDPDAPGSDVVSVKWVDAIVMLGLLVAKIRGVDWNTELVGTTQIHTGGPAEPPTGKDWDEVTEDEWAELLDGEVFVERIGVSVRDDLADVEDGQIPDLAAQWSTVEEWSTERFDLTPTVTGLVGLARRARSRGEHLYCWYTC